MALYSLLVGPYSLLEVLYSLLVGPPGYLVGRVGTTLLTSPDMVVRSRQVCTGAHLSPLYFWDRVPKYRVTSIQVPGRYPVFRVPGGTRTLYLASPTLYMALYMAM